MRSNVRGNVCAGITDDHKQIEKGAETYQFVTGQTLATPTPVKRASSSSCLRGSKLCNSSIMAGERGRESTLHYVSIVMLTDWRDSDVCVTCWVMCPQYMFSRAFWDSWLSLATTTNSVINSIQPKAIYPIDNLRGKHHDHARSCDTSIHVKAHATRNVNL